MHLTKLSLTNFRSFGQQTQTIDFGKVTLLFGPNSVGKSTVLLALFYVQEILAKGDCNPQYIEALGDKYVGGFKNLVNGKDVNKTIKIELEYEKSDIGRSYFDVMDLVKTEAVAPPMDDYAISEVTQMESPAVYASKMAVEFEIAWSQRMKQAFVKACNIHFDSECIVTITSDDGLNPTITGLNYIHPLLIPNSIEELFAYAIDRDEIHLAVVQAALEDAGKPRTEAEIIQKLSLQKDKKEDSPGLPDIIESAIVSEFHELICGDIPPYEYSNPNFKSGINVNCSMTLLHKPISFRNTEGALPPLGVPFESELVHSNEFRSKVAQEILSDIIVAPLDNLLEILSRSLSIGPLRAVPTKESQPKTIPTQKGWFDGSAGWACLVREQERILPIISKKLDKGIYKELSNEIDGALGANTITKTDIWLSKLGYQLASEQAVGKQNLLYAQASIMQLDEWFSGSLGLYDLHNKVFVQPSDIGVGVSQLLPLIVAALTVKKGFVAIEQPELHVHPRVQVDVGDLLTQVVDGPNFIVETHSEHIILRLLKRIRQTTDGELPEGFVPVTPADVSINYLDASEHGVQITRLNIDEDGEFIERWPGGFFAERREELW
jgi:hypothetical protein